MLDMDSPSIEILTSRDGIRNQLVDYAKSYLELENVDLYYTSFLSYIINVLSVLSASQLYYTSTIYREFFLTEAQLEESVYNLAKWIGYTPDSAQPSICDVLITIPLNFKTNDASFLIPTDFRIMSGDIIYTTDLPITIKIDSSGLTNEYTDMDNEGINVRVLNNKAVTVRNSSGYFYPVVLNSDDDNASFLVPFTQYEIQEFTYQVPDNLEIYQFWSINVEYDGMAWKQEVYETYNYGAGDVKVKLDQAEANSLYTMTSTDKKYVFIKGHNKGVVYFGNGIIGKQPQPGSLITVKMFITKGEGGRVIAGTLNKSDKVYYKFKDAGVDKVLPIKIKVTNPSPAYGGEDSPSISQVKNRAIANLTSKQRFVSSQDYDDLEDIIPNPPLTDAVPILKRSDIKVNEIMLFTRLKYQDMICPTRNIVIPMDSTSIVNTDLIPAGTIFDVDGENYETMFAMIPDYSNDFVEYQYTLNEVNITPVLESTTSFAQYCYIIISNMNFKRNGSALEIVANITEIPDSIYDFECIMTTGWDGLNFNMITDIDTEGNIVSFSYTFYNYYDVPPNQQRFRFRITGMVHHTYISGSNIDERKTISQYTSDVIVRKSLEDYMMSSLTEESGIDYIHNVPVIKSSYFITEDIDRTSFELLTVQELIANIDINSKRMLTDFLNIKFSDTSGLLTNMKYNTPTRGGVLSKTQTTAPISPLDGESWIVNGTENTLWFEKRDYIATWYDIGGWSYFTPNVNDSIYVQDEDQTYVYTGCDWIIPVFNIPFEIEAIITKDPASPLSASQIINNVKNELLNNFVIQFGIDVDIDKSEILSIIRSVPGVTYAKLYKPEIDIRFKYNPVDLDIAILLDYTPQMVAFSYDTITIALKD